MIYPLISIIVPIYNVEPYLRRCIDSILAQTYSNIEVILIDDGSPDKCPAICDDYATKDARVIALHKPNGGLSDARNAGLDIAKGEYIGFIDSDDYIAPDMYEKLYAAISKSEADLAICAYLFVDESGNIDKSRIFPIKNKIMNQTEAFNAICKRTIKKTVFVTAFNKLYKHSLLNETGNLLRFPVGRLNEDEFLIHHILGRCKKIITISDNLYYYVQRRNSIMAKYTLKRLDGCYAVMDRISFFKEKGEGRLAKKSYYHACCVLFSALLRLDMSYAKNRSAIRPLYWHVLFNLIISFDLIMAGGLIMAGSKLIWDMAKRRLSIMLKKGES